MNGWMFVLIILVGWIAYTAGWITAHKTVADECEKLGSFYVGKKVFRCVLIEVKE